MKPDLQRLASDRKGSEQPASANDSRTITDTSKTLADCGPTANPLTAPEIRREIHPIPDHELIRRIGQGSYGEVWLARNVMGTYRAVKIVYRATFEHARPFEREFTGIKKFEPISRSHDGLVDVLQVGRTDEYFYYVMDKTIRFWSPVPRGQSTSIDRFSPVYGRSVFSADSSLLATGSATNCVTVWRVVDLQPQADLSPARAPLAFSRDSAFIYTLGFEPVLTVWSVQGGLSRQIPLQDATLPRAAVLSPGNKLLASKDNGRLKLWDATTGALLTDLSPVLARMEAMQFSPDGALLCWQTPDRAVKLWDVRERRERGTLFDEEMPNDGGMAFSPDSQLLAIGSNKGEISLWDLSTNTKRAALRGHKEGIYAVSFSPDGKTLASANGDVKLWNLVTGREVASFPHTQDVWSATFSPDDRTLIAGGVNQPLRVWRAASWAEIEQAEQNNGRPNQ